MKRPLFHTLVLTGNCVQEKNTADTKEVNLGVDIPPQFYTTGYIVDLTVRIPMTVEQYAKYTAFRQHSEYTSPVKVHLQNKEEV